jgi:glycosyltransferase involved in cell wall biosynthesis
MKPDLTVIIPVYNEGTTIGTIIKEVLRQECVAQVIVVDDCSVDETWQILNEIDDIRLIKFRHPTNRGKGASLRTAIQEITQPITIFQDADLEYSPSSYEKLTAPIREKRADVVFGSRFLVSGERRVIYFWHYLANRFLTLLTNLVTNLNLSDMETCYKVTRSDILKNLNLRENRFGIEPEITIKLAREGLRFYEVPISYHGRSYEEGKKIGFKDGVRALYCIMRYTLSRGG